MPPLYDYECGDCGETREYEHAMGTRPKFCSAEDCYAPGEKLSRVFTAQGAPQIGATTGAGKRINIIRKGAYINSQTGETRNIGTVREVRRTRPDGRKTLESVAFVDLENGKPFTPKGELQIIEFPRE